MYTPECQECLEIFKVLWDEHLSWWTTATCQVPAKVFSHSPSPKAQTGENVTKRVWIKVKSKRSLSNFCHRQNRIDLGKHLLSFELEPESLILVLTSLPWFHVQGQLPEVQVSCISIQPAETASRYGTSTDSLGNVFYSRFYSEPSIVKLLEVKT